MSQTRRLAAILATDVAGYSRLIGADEGDTLTRLKAIRAELIDPTIAAHNGRLVKTTGDALLVEFGSVVEVLRWGLVPYWAKDLKVGFANINAKAEGIENRPAFREAFQRRRCLVPVDNFYEWKKTGAGKQPYAIALADRGLMALAGLWENWRSPA